MIVVDPLEDRVHLQRAQFPIREILQLERHRRYELDLRGITSGWRCFEPTSRDILDLETARQIDRWRAADGERDADHDDQTESPHIREDTAGARFVSAI